MKVRDIQDLPINSSGVYRLLTLLVLGLFSIHPPFGYGDLANDASLEAGVESGRPRSTAENSMEQRIIGMFGAQILQLFSGPYPL
jgi:hypothetical protein